MSSLDRLLWPGKIEYSDWPTWVVSLALWWEIGCCDWQPHQGHLAWWPNGFSKKIRFLEEEKEVLGGGEKCKTRNSKWYISIIKDTIGHVEIQDKAIVWRNITRKATEEGKLCIWSIANNLSCILLKQTFSHTIPHFLLQKPANFAQVNKRMGRSLKEYVHFSTFNCVIPILQIIKLTRRSLVACLRLWS